MSEVKRLEAERKDLDRRLDAARRREQGEALKAVFGRWGAMDSEELTRELDKVLWGPDRTEFADANPPQSTQQFLARVEDPDVRLEKLWAGVEE